MLTDRRRFVLGGAALAAAPTVLRAQIETVTPEQFGAVGDLRGDRGTDDTEAFRRMADYLGASGARARLSRRYRITGGFAVYAGALEFTDDALVRNTNRDPRFIWRNACMFVGTWMGYTGASSLNLRPQHRILPMEADSDRVVFAAGAVPPDVVPGGLLYLKDGRRFPGHPLDFRVASHVATVVAVEGRTAILREPSPFSIGGGPGKPATALTAASGVPIHPVQGVPAASTRLARGVTIVNGAFECAQKAARLGLAVYFACHDCDLDFRWLSGSKCIGGNPCSDSSISVRDGEFTDGLIELAYFHARVRGEVIRGRRIGSVPARGVAPVSITEYGHSVNFRRIEVADAPAQGDAMRPTVVIGAPRNEIGQLRVSDAGPIAVRIGNNGSMATDTSIDDLIVAGGRKYGVWIDCDDVRLGTVTVAGLRDADPVPLVLRPGAGRNVAIGATRFEPGQSVRDLRSRR